jgi:hypothetical protein
VIDSERLTAWLIAITTGTTEPPDGLTAYEREVFQRLVVQVAEIRDKGHIVEIPFD